MHVRLLARALKGQPSPGNRKGRRMRLVGSFGRVKKSKLKKKERNRKQNAGDFRFFYCIPIGTVAYTVWASHRSPGGSDGRQSRRLARHAGTDGPEDFAGHGPAAWLRDCSPHRAD